MKAGINRCIITPPFTGFELAGFGRPDRKCRGVYDDITLTTLALQHETGKCILICADLIGFGRQMVQDLKQEIKQQFGFSESEVLFNASHTHSGPATLANMNAYLGKMDERYLPFLRDSVISSIKSALASMEDADMYAGKGSISTIGINRRRLDNGILDFAPNPDGMRDDDVTVLKIAGRNGVKAVLFNYACHPSTLDTDYLSADFPGAARKRIENGIGKDAIALFMQGCCGDIRVRTIENNFFRAGTLKDVEEFGEKLAGKVLEVCRGEMDKIEPELSGTLADITLKLQDLPEKSHLETIRSTGAPYQQQWAQDMLADYGRLKNEFPYTLQKIVIGDRFVIYGMDGEVCTEYSLYVKGLNKGKYAITAGYSNGNIGYIPTEEMFGEGGYEPIESTACYSLPSPFDTGIEKQIKQKLKEL